MLATSYQSFIFVVRPNPNPDLVLVVRNSQGSMAGAYPCRPYLSDLLEMKGGMSWVLAQKKKGFVRQFSYLRR